MSIGFWICLSMAVINLIVAIIFASQGDSRCVPYIIGFAITAFCTLGIGISDFDENVQKATKEIVVENVKTVQIDTAYIISNGKTDTIYVIKYIK